MKRTTLILMLAAFFVSTFAVLPGYARENRTALSTDMIREIETDQVGAQEQNLLPQPREWNTFIQVWIPWERAIDSEDRRGRNTVNNERIRQQPRRFDEQPRSIWFMSSDVKYRQIQ